MFEQQFHFKGVQNESQYLPCGLTGINFWDQFQTHVLMNWHLVRQFVLQGIAGLHVDWSNFT